MNYPTYYPKRDEVSKNKYQGWSDRELTEDAAELMDRISKLIEEIKDARSLSDSYIYELERRHRKEIANG